jgi:hypothetical protein
MYFKYMKKLIDDQRAKQPEGGVIVEREREEGEFLL